MFFVFLFSLCCVLGRSETRNVSAETLPQELLHASAIVLVNHNSTYYSDFQHYLQPYLNHFGVPYTVLDIASQAIEPDIGNYALVIIGHRQLDRYLTFLDSTEQGYLAAAVEAGTGLVNFDNDLSSAGSSRYQYVQDIFGFGYNTTTTGSGVTFVTVDPGEDIVINCADDDHQEPILTTFTNPALFNDLDGAWDEFLWVGYRDYAGVFGGVAEASTNELQMMHFYGDVPNGTYRLIANLYHSRDYRYYWGYTPENPRTYSYDVISGPSGDFAEFELGTIEITDSRFDLYTDYAQDLGGSSFAYFGWAWIRLVPVDAPPPGMHFITERHQPGEYILTGSMTMAGITLPADVDSLALTGTQPFLAATTHGNGRAVQWGTYDWMSHTVKGPVYGLDDLVWRSLVWAARKPFVMQGVPNFVTMRVDDVSGPFEWIEIANEFGFKPWAGLFYYDIDFMEARKLSALVNSGNATASVHAKAETTFFYYDHGIGDFPENIVAENFTNATSWHTTHNIPISRFVLPHFYEFGSNIFQGLRDWGVEFVGTLMDPGSGYYSPWIMNGPYRLYESGESNTELPTFYADFMTISGHPEFDDVFFNCVTEIRDDAGYEWYPSNDVAGSIGRGVRQTKRALDSMALATLFTHGYYIEEITAVNWRSILQGITADLAPYDPVYVTLDDACQYLRAMHTSNIRSSSYDPDGTTLTTILEGATDIKTQFYLFWEQDGEIEHLMVDVPIFSGSVNVVSPLSNALDHIVVTPAVVDVAAGGTQRFTALGYDSAGTPIPGLSFRWDVVNGGGTIDENGLFSAGLTAGSYPDTVQASLLGVIGAASVDVFIPILDHFTFQPIESPVFEDTPFQITVTARDEAENLVVSYTGSADLSDSTESILPGTTGSFSGGSWTGEVTIGQAAHEVIISASDGVVTGNSVSFEVLPLPKDYQVTSAAYRYRPGEPFLVTVSTPANIGMEQDDGVPLNLLLNPENSDRWLGNGEVPGRLLEDLADPGTLRLAVAVITLSSNSPTMVFDADGDGIFGEPGDDVKFLVGDSFSIMALDTTSGHATTIVATDNRGRYGYNNFTILFMNYLPGISVKGVD